MELLNKLLMSDVDFDDLKEQLLVWANEVGVQVALAELKTIQERANAERMVHLVRYQEVFKNVDGTDYSKARAWDYMLLLDNANGICENICEITMELMPKTTHQWN